MSFFTYSQNNSGGTFDYNDSGITHYVIVEADNNTEAKILAEEIGLYFNGVDEGVDCPCCGDRWFHSSFDKGTTEPKIYDVSVRIAAKSCPWRREFPKGSAAVHYKSGKVEWF